MDSSKDRVESLKAGSLGFFIAAIAFWPFSQLNAALAGVTPILHDLTSWGQSPSLASALFASGLFAITYRYIVRTDDNPHLRSGAIGAFAFVRGGAQIEAGWVEQANLEPLCIVVGESFLLLAIVAATLDWFMRRGWLQSLE